MNTENKPKIIDIIPSKSDAHRALICAALAGGKTRVVCDETSEDIEATKDCLRALMDPANEKTGSDLYCRESGSTLRFLVPVVGALGKRGIFHPKGRLTKRPMSPLQEELCSHGMKISDPGSVPFIAEGKLKGGDFVIPGNVSSQFVSGLLFALPLLQEDSRIIVTGELESAGYVDMTARALTRFGIDIVAEKVGQDIICSIPGRQSYVGPEEYIVEGDWSNAAFWLAAGLLGDTPITVRGLSEDSAQGDRRIVEAIQAFGGKVTRDGDEVTTYPAGDKLKGIQYDARQNPDLVPVIALIAAHAKGITNIVNAGRLRSKESDRLHTIGTTLKKLGADIAELEEGLRIKGTDKLTGGIVESFDDHRIAMMAAIASIVCDNKVSILGWEATSKSYPSFYDRLKDLELDNNVELV